MTEAHLVNMAGHAAVGCGASAASGGSCQSGALAGLVPAFAGPMLPTNNFTVRLMANSALGGAASVAGGGKFANGAVTGAFGYLFNSLGQSAMSQDGSTGGGEADQARQQSRSVQVALNILFGAGATAAGGTGAR